MEQISLCNPSTMMRGVTNSRGCSTMKYLDKSSCHLLTEVQLSQVTCGPILHKSALIFSLNVIELQTLRCGRKLSTSKPHFNKLHINPLKLSKIYQSSHTFNAQ
ncbi:hypothetical protein O6H91_23G049000 [Diphasiastrum complanatum]|uniref:Uncharacterized protein n=1 Tax=Diphasiastrum complanatum TaxID=34168 RepID=A0ACC2AAN8_DIPCM|nr:hypothetical protein O6H91_23G049000 [Diphasiastrum complanatum]